MLQDGLQPAPRALPGMFWFRVVVPAERPVGPPPEPLHPPPPWPGAVSGLQPCRRQYPQDRPAEPREQVLRLRRQLDQLETWALAQLLEMELGLAPDPDIRVLPGKQP